MKNRLLLFFVLFAFLLSAALPVSSVQALENGRTYELIELKHVRSKGYTAVFKIHGNWNKGKHLNKAQTLVYVDGIPYKMACNIKDDGVVSCTMDNFAVGQLRGKNVWFWFDGAGSASGSATVSAVVPEHAPQCRAWRAEFFHGYHDENWLETNLSLVKTYTLLWEYEGAEAWGTVTYGDGASLPSYYSENLEIDFYSWLAGKSWIESGSLESEWFGYKNLKECASWGEEPFDQTSYDYQGWAEWSGEGGEICVGTNCWLVDEEWEEHDYESCESEDGACFSEDD